MVRVLYDGKTYGMGEIERLPNLYRIVDPTGYNLEYDILNFTLRSDGVGEQRLLENHGFWLATSSNEGIVVNYGNLENFVYGAEVVIEDDYGLKAVMYVTDIVPTYDRQNRAELFHVKCVSAIGLLSRMEHGGGVYSGTTVGEIIRELMDTLPYTIDNALAAEKLYGWLPYTSDARKNLHKVLFATGAMVQRNELGDTHFTYNHQTIAHDVPKHRTFYGGVNSKKEHKSSVTVIEHGFYKSSQAEEELVYDNTDSAYADNVKITFSDPCYDYRGDGLEVIQSSANWAIVTGVGYLYAKKYIHTQRPLSAVIDTEGQPEVLSISDQTLVSSLNVNGIIERFVNYYANARIRTFDMEVTYEHPGELIEFYDRRGVENVGYIKSMDEKASSFWRGTVKVVTDWTPTRPGNDFTRYLIVKESDIAGGVWSVPAEMRGKRARVVLFSGAQGGQGGYAGGTNDVVRGGNDDITLYSSDENDVFIGGLQDGVQSGADGGAGGRGGSGATRMINIDVDELAASYPVEFGAGGEGGIGGTVTRSETFRVVTTEPEYGQEGGDSAFNGISTSRGAVFKGTYVNLITGDVIVTSGQDGTAGGRGGHGGYSEQIRGPYVEEADAEAYFYETVGKGENGESVGSYSGGAGHVGTRGQVRRAEYNWRIDDGYYVFGSAGGGGGGGAAMGSAGSPGDAGESILANYTENSPSGSVRVRKFVVNEVSEDQNYAVTLRGAKGGDGADATIIPAKPVHVGGHGGHGGGGGGGAGQCMGWAGTISGNTDHYYGKMYGGKGGNGGKGGDGSDGFMIIYW